MNALLSLLRVARVEITFGKELLRILHSQNACTTRLDVSRHPLPELVDCLAHEYTLVEARKFSRDPSTTGHLRLRFASWKRFESRNPIPAASRIFPILRGLSAEPWDVCAAYEPLDRSGDGATNLRLHFMPWIDTEGVDHSAAICRAA